MQTLMATFGHATSNQLMTFFILLFWWTLVSFAAGFWFARKIGIARLDARHYDYQNRIWNEGPEVGTKVRGPWQDRASTWHGRLHVFHPGDPSGVSPRSRCSECGQPEGAQHHIVPHED